jgi:pantoate--beta-alanine ligase
VCTVVLKLFNAVRPHRAWFGKKDIQQALILKRMVSDLALDVEMILSETVREPEELSAGLALSSRNAYLTDDERQRAAALHRGLMAARSAFESGEREATVLKNMIRAVIEASRPTRIDYLEVVSQSALEPVDRIDTPCVMAVAVFYGGTRLIDNELLDLVSPKV